MSQSTIQFTRRGALLFASLALLVAAPLALPKVAHADANDCPVGRVCMWEHIRADGAMISVVPTHNTCYNLTPGWQNRVSSVRNYTNYHLLLISGPNCSGTWSQELIGYEFANLNFMNDRTVSWWYY